MDRWIFKTEREQRGELSVNLQDYVKTILCIFTELDGKNLLNFGADLNQATDPAFYFHLL